MGAAMVYGAAQGLSAYVARYAQGRGTRPQYEQFQRQAFAPPGAVFPVVWSALNITTATSAWQVWRAAASGSAAPARSCQPCLAARAGRAAAGVAAGHQAGGLRHPCRLRAQRRRAEPGQLVGAARPAVDDLLSRPAARNLRP